MTNAQTEARAIALPATRPFVGRLIRIFTERPGDDTSAVVLIEYAQAALATALAAKDAELAAEHAALRLAADRADRAEARLAEARKALDQIERKICAAEHGHTINDVLANYREVRRTVQDARAARRALKGGQVE